MCAPRGVWNRALRGIEYFERTKLAKFWSRENNLSSLGPQTYWKPIDCAKKYKQGDWQAVVASLDPGVRLALMRASDTGLCNDKTCEHCSAKLCSCLGHSKFCSQCGASV